MSLVKLILCNITVAIPVVIRIKYEKYFFFMVWFFSLNYNRMRFCFANCNIVILYLDCQLWIFVYL